MSEVPCPECGKLFVSSRGLGAHRRYRHNVAGRTRPPLPASAGEEAASSSSVVFRSPMSAGLRVVVRPSYWSRVETPAGIQQTISEGKVAEFHDGVLVTDDREIIEFLENKYKDDRYPVLSERKMRKLGEKCPSGSQESPGGSG